MRDSLRRNPVLAVLGLLAVALAAILAVEVSTGGPTVPAGPSRKAVPAEVKLLPPMAAASPEQAYPETTARPLFSPTRRPAPPVVAAAQPAIQRGQFVLLGVTIAGDTRIAMLRERSSGRLHRVEKGREINGLKVAEIERESVTLAAGAENETMSLTVQKPGGAPGQPAPGGVPAAAVPAGPFGQSAFGVPPPPAVNVPQRAAPPPAVPVPGAALPAGPMGAAGAANNTTVPATPNVPMTPEELLERRRLRRAQQTQ